MARQPINHGTVAGDGTGESLFSAFTKVNANETELYAAKTEVVANEAALPVTGEATKLYVAYDTGVTYKWTGTAYRAITLAPTYDVGGNVTGLVGAGGSEYYLGMEIYNPVALKPWRRKRGKASAAGAGRPAVVAVVGDSLVYGIQGNSSATETSIANDDGTYVGDSNWANFASQIVNAKLGKTAPVTWDALDSRITAASTTNVSSVGLNGRCKQLTSTGPGTLTFPATSCKRFEIGYFETTATSGDVASGGFSHNVDAAGAVAVSTASAFRTGKIATTSALTEGSHTLVLTGTTAAPAYITHAFAYTDGGVAIVRIGRAGWSLADALGLGANNTSSAGGQGRLLAAFGQAGWFDLVLIEFAHNDAEVYTPETYGTYLDTIIAAVPATSTIGLISPPYAPAAQDQGAYGARTAYWDVMKEKALANANVFHARMSSAFGTRDEADADSLYDSTGTVHLSSAGYALGGQFIADLLLM